MYKKKKYLGLLILGIIVICIVMCVINRKLEVEAISEAISLVGGVIICIISMLILVHSIFGSEESHSRNRDDIENYYNDLRQKILQAEIDSQVLNTENNSQVENKEKEISQYENRDIIELMIANMKEINEYYVLSKKMTKDAFVLAVCMCIGGFFIISTSVIFILLNNIDAIQAILPIISGAVIEAIAATTLIVYKKSLEQLNRYYDALHDNEIFLSAVNLANKISYEKRDDTYNYIIKTKLESTKGHEGV